MFRISRLVKTRISPRSTLYTSNRLFNVGTNDWEAIESRLEGLKSKISSIDTSSASMAQRLSVCMPWRLLVTEAVKQTSAPELKRFLRIAAEYSSNMGEDEFLMNSSLEVASKIENGAMMDSLISRMKSQNIPITPVSFKSFISKSSEKGITQILEALKKIEAASPSSISGSFLLRQVLKGLSECPSAYAVLSQEEIRRVKEIISVFTDNVENAMSYYTSILLNFLQTDSIDAKPGFFQMVFEGIIPHLVMISLNSQSIFSAMSKSDLQEFMSLGMDRELLLNMIETAISDADFPLDGRNLMEFTANCVKATDTEFGSKLIDRIVEKSVFTQEEYIKFMSVLKDESPDAAALLGLKVLEKHPNMDKVRPFSSILDLIKKRVTDSQLKKKVAGICMKDRDYSFSSLVTRKEYKKAAKLASTFSLEKITRHTTELNEFFANSRGLYRDELESVLKKVRSLESPPDLIQLVLLHMKYDNVRPSLSEIKNDVALLERMGCTVPVPVYIRLLRLWDPYRFPITRRLMATWRDNFREVGLSSGKEYKCALLSHLLQVYPSFDALLKKIAKNLLASYDDLPIQNLNDCLRVLAGEGEEMVREILSMISYQSEQTPASTIAVLLDLCKDDVSRCEDIFNSFAKDNFVNYFVLDVMLKVYARHHEVDKFKALFEKYRDQVIESKDFDRIVAEIVQCHGLVISDQLIQLLSSNGIKLNRKILQLALRNQMGKGLPSEEVVQFIKFADEHYPVQKGNLDTFPNILFRSALLVPCNADLPDYIQYYVSKENSVVVDYQLVMSIETVCVNTETYLTFVPKVFSWMKNDEVNLKSKILFKVFQNNVDDLVGTFEELFRNIEENGGQVGPEVVESCCAGMHNRNYTNEIVSLIEAYLRVFPDAEIDFNKIEKSIENESKRSENTEHDETAQIEHRESLFDGIK